MEVVQFQNATTGSGPSHELVEINENTKALASKQAVVPMRPRPQRPPSCRLQLIASPCVRKVSLHLELLSNTIQDVLDARRRLHPNRGPDTQLEVVGVGQKADFKKLQKEARVITDDALGIVTKLEDDIADTESRLQYQRETAGNFKSGLHKLRRKQLLTLHSAVDSEHSSCTYDIQELEWHVNYEKRQVGNLEKRHNIALKLNVDLRKDIDFFEKSKPELSVKADNEGSMMTEIDSEETVAKVELQKRSVVLKDTTEKHDVAITKINEERDFIEKDLTKVRKKLADVKQAIIDARAEYDYMVEKKARSEKLIQKNKLDKQLFDLKADNTRGAIRQQSDVNAKFSAELDALMEESRETETQLMNYIAEFETQKATWEDILTRQQEDLNALGEKHRVLHQEANDFEALVDDRSRDLDALKKRKTDLDQNVRRMEKDIIKYEDQMLLIVGEIAKLEHLVYAAETELKKIISQNSEAERAKRSIIENLKQQINILKQEIQTLDARFEADTEELNGIRNHTEWKRQQFEKLIAEQDASIADKTKKVNRLEQKNNERLATVASLEQKLADLRSLRESTENRLDQDASQARLRIISLKKQKEDQLSEMRSMRMDTERLNRLLKELNEAGASMIAAGERYDARLLELDGIYKEASTQMKWRKIIEDELQDRLVSNRDKLMDGAERHQTNLSQRQQALRIITECLGSNLYYNAYLKAKYRMRQNELNDTRNITTNAKLTNSLSKMKAIDAALVTSFLQMFESSNDLSCQVRRALCTVHQGNTDCQCGRNVRDVRDITVTLSDDTKEDGKQILEIVHTQAKIRGDTTFSDFSVVPFDVATNLVSNPPINLANKS